MGHSIMDFALLCMMTKFDLWSLMLFMVSNSLSPSDLPPPVPLGLVDSSFTLSALDSTFILASCAEF